MLRGKLFTGAASLGRICQTQVILYSNELRSLVAWMPVSDRVQPFKHINAPIEGYSGILSAFLICALKLSRSAVTLLPWLEHKPVLDRESSCAPLLH